MSGIPEGEYEVTFEASDFHGNVMEPIFMVIYVGEVPPGTTTDTNRTVDLVRARGALVVAIVNRRGSDLVDKADGVLYTADGRDVEMSVASTKAFYSQVAAGFILADAIASGIESSQPTVIDVATDPEARAPAAWHPREMITLTDWENGFSLLWGSGITTLLSLVFLITVNLRKNIQHFPWFLSAIALSSMIFDQYLYTFGNPADALDGAIMMGVNPVLFKSIVIGLVMVQGWLLIRLVFRYRRGRQARPMVNE